MWPFHHIESLKLVDVRIRVVVSDGSIVEQGPSPTETGNQEKKTLSTRVWAREFRVMEIILWDNENTMSAILCYRALCLIACVLCFMVGCTCLFSLWVEMLLNNICSLVLPILGGQIFSWLCRNRLSITGGGPEKKGRVIEERRILEVYYQLLGPRVGWLVT